MKTCNVILFPPQLYSPNHEYFRRRRNVSLYKSFLASAYTFSLFSSLSSFAGTPFIGKKALGMNLQCSVLRGRCRFGTKTAHSQLDSFLELPTKDTDRIMSKIKGKKNVIGGIPLSGQIWNDEDIRRVERMPLHPFPVDTDHSTDLSHSLSSATEKGDHSILKGSDQSFTPGFKDIIDAVHSITSRFLQKGHFGYNWEVHNIDRRKRINDIFWDSKMYHWSCSDCFVGQKNAVFSLQNRYVEFLQLHNLLDKSKAVSAYYILPGPWLTSLKQISWPCSDPTYVSFNDRHELGNELGNKYRFDEIFQRNLKQRAWTAKKKNKSYSLKKLEDSADNLNPYMVEMFRKMVRTKTKDEINDWLSIKFPDKEHLYVARNFLERMIDLFHFEDKVKNFNRFVKNEPEA